MSRSRRAVGTPRLHALERLLPGHGGDDQFDEEKYVGSGVFLFASVLEKFLGLYASLNSFTQLIATPNNARSP